MELVIPHDVIRPELMMNETRKDERTWFLVKLAIFFSVVVFTGVIVAVTYGLILMLR